MAALNSSVKGSSLKNIQGYYVSLSVPNECRLKNTDLVFSIPSEFKLSHALHHALQLGIPDKADQCCSRLAATEKRKLGQISS